jgi:hypothetical protein
MTSYGSYFSSLAWGIIDAGNLFYGWILQEHQLKWNLKMKIYEEQEVLFVCV